MKYIQRYLILKNRCTKSFSIYVQLIRQGCIYQKIIQIPTSKSPTYAMKKTIMPNGSITLFIITARLLALENEVCDEDVKPTGGTLLPIRELNCSSIKNKSKKLRLPLSFIFMTFQILHYKKEILKFFKNLLLI
ncbi:hypothetical protein T06_8725 [Trichinella sp. T6]|nr:hypothetical protein T06_8725 [Trichinella sp. T6]